MLCKNWDAESIRRLRSNADMEIGSVLLVQVQEVMAMVSFLPVSLATSQDSAWDGGETASSLEVAMTISA